MQKLLTICLHNQDHCAVEEHLKDWLTSGWRVDSMRTAASSTGGAWLAIVLDDGPQSSCPNIQKMEFPESEEGKPVEPSDVAVRPDTPLKIGSTVLSFSQGRWWRAVVIALEPDDCVRIHYPGWDAKWDVTVSRDELQVDLHGFRE